MAISRRLMLGTVLISVSALCAKFPANCAAGDEVAKPETIEKYKAIFESLEETYGSATGSGVYFAAGVKDNRLDGRIHRVPFHFKQRPKMYRVEMPKTNPDSGEKVEAADGPGYTTVATAEKIFSLLREKKDGPFRLIKLERSSPKGIVAVKRRFLYAFDSPYHLHNESFREMIERPDIIVYEPTMVEIEGRKLIRLVAGRGPTGTGFNQVKPGTQSFYRAVYLDPELGFALRGYSSAASSKIETMGVIWASTTVDYKKADAGPALLSRYTLKCVQSDVMIDLPHKLDFGIEVVGRLMDDIHVEFDNYRLEKTPENEFDLPAFGFDNIAIPIEPNPANVPPGNPAKPGVPLPDIKRP